MVKRTDSLIRNTSEGLLSLVAFVALVAGVCLPLEKDNRAGKENPFPGTFPGVQRKSLISNALFTSFPSDTASPFNDMLLTAGFRGYQEVTDRILQPAVICPGPGGRFSTPRARLFHPE